MKILGGRFFSPKSSIPCLCWTLWARGAAVAGEGWVSPWEGLALQ